MERKNINFGAGPTKLPLEVLKEIEKNLINYEGTGISVMEMSHRSVDYMKINQSAMNDLRELMGVPSNYKILFMLGGGTGGFSSSCLNLMGRTGTADYLVTGAWSEKAAKEATHFGKVNLVLPKVDKYTGIPPQDTWNLDPNASFVYYCDNETADGVEFDFIPETNGVPLVCDMSSNFLSRPIDVSKFGIIFAAQKNVVPAGMTVVIVREDLMGHPMKITPSILDYNIVDNNNSIYNTPPTFIVHVMSLIFKWIKRNGGIEGMGKTQSIKSKLLYEIVDNSNGFYSCPIDKKDRSRMNVCFRIGSAAGDEELEKEFLELCESNHLVQLHGHRLVGGVRASIYNAITIAETQALANLMISFLERKKK
ncbi:probable phosphoserine aminotransferase [Episyrphus balteatus]|uniref:probable phosphoserine aminotransferase n=1 Tax=Episyrphus balteatus TaxID=286459 RepID=UPI002486582D|nr:probable phosphoserine aminotransferase [Episyrphus balteatus]